MATVQITIDPKESEPFDAQYEALIGELRKRGLVATRTVGRPAPHERTETETVIRLLGHGMEVADAVSEIRAAARQCLSDTVPGLLRHVHVYGPEGQRLLDLEIEPAPV